MLALTLRLALTPVLITASSLAGRRWGERIGGWLVALPLTSGPIDLLLCIDHGNSFAADAAVGMLAGTISQVGFAVAYQATAHRGPFAALAAGGATFAAVTALVSWLTVGPGFVFLLTVAAVAAGSAWSRRHNQATRNSNVIAPTARSRWDLPTRAAIATTAVVALTAVAPLIGPYATGMLSPFPIFGAVVAIKAHLSNGSMAARRSLEGLTLGLAAPALFFLTLSLALPQLGLPAFLAAAATALVTQATTLFISRDRAQEPALTRPRI